MRKTNSSLRIEINSKCNINCKYCHNSNYANKKDDMSFEELKKLILGLKKKYPLHKVLITGGEPLLHPNIEEIIKFISDLRIKCDMVTNGKLLTENKIHKFEECGLKRIRISIDGIGAEHNLYRVGSNANRLWRLAEYAVKHTKMSVVIHTVCSEHNVHKLFSVYKKILSVGADRWRIFDVGYDGAAVKNIAELDITKYYNDLIYSIVDIIKHYIENDLSKKLDIEINGIFKTSLLNNAFDDYMTIDNNELLESILGASPCAYIDHQMTIRSNGISTLCQFFHNPIVDYKRQNYSVESNIKLPKPQEILLKTKDIKYCKNCKYILVCNSGCRAKAEFLTGNMLNPDPTYCVIMPLLYDKIIPLYNKGANKAFNKLLIGDNEPYYTANDLKNMMQKRINRC